MTRDEALQTAREILPLDVASDDCGFCNFAELRELIAAALLEASGGWQPIETAEMSCEPKMLWDGNYIAVGNYQIYHSHEGELLQEGWFSGGELCDPQPTHWRPLPPPPAT